MAITQQLLPVEQGELPLTVVRGSGSGAGVVIMPSAFGVGPDLTSQMEELGAHSRLVVALDPFFREDPGASPYDDMGRVMSRIQSVDRARAHRDLRAAIEWTHKEAGSAPIMVGICFGGAYSLLVAAEGMVSGVVTWHGSRMEGFLDKASEMRCPMRLHFGAVDPFVPMTAVAAVRAAFAGREDVEVVVHEGATHGFSHRHAPAYDERAERAGMAALRELVGG